MAEPRTVLVTGATSGIGKHAALHFARRGYATFASFRNREAIAGFHGEPGADQLKWVELDVTKPASIAAAAEEIDRATAGHGVDVLINNAGYGAAGALADLSDAQLRAQFETNVFGLMAVTRTFVPKMRERGWGRILNVSSVGGRVTFPLFGAYHATKYAVEAMSDALRYELVPFGVHVVLIEPGVIRSEFSRKSAADASARVAGSPYAVIYQRAEAIRARTDAQAVGPECVSRAMERAVRARTPRARYVAPMRTYLVLWLARALPTRLWDAVLRRAIGLTHARLKPRT
jgi:NAD(P)-dependent dehydrogenase (short-subunit alcohol dehydrogenase family)